MSELARDRALAAAALLLAVAIALYLWFPWSVEAAELQGTLVVADVRGSALVVLDLERPDEPRRIALPGRPHELLVLPDGRVVASLERAGAIVVVEPAGGEVRRIELGGTPHGLALHDGTLFVTDRSRDAIRRFLSDDWSELPPLATGGAPHAIAVLDDGRITVANAASGTLQLGQRAIEVSALPEAVAVSGSEIAVAGALGGEVERFAPDGSWLGGVSVGGRPVRLVYAPDGETLAVALSASGSVALLDRAGAVRRIEVGGVADGLAFNPDGRRLFVADLASGSVALVELAGGREIARWAVAESAGALLVLPE